MNLTEDYEAEAVYTLSSVLTGCMRSDEEIQVLKYLADKYHIRTVSDESRATGLSRQAIYNRIKAKKTATVELNNKSYIIF